MADKAVGCNRKTYTQICTVGSLVGDYVCLGLGVRCWSMLITRLLRTTTRYRTKHLLYLGFNLLYINISKNNNSLILWLIPFVVIIFEIVDGDGFDVVGSTNGHPIAVASAVEKRLALFLHNHRRTQAIFFEYYRPFALNVLGVEGQRTRPIAQQQQTGIDVGFICGDRHIVKVVFGIVPRGSGVGVVAKIDAYAAHKFDGGIVGKMFRAIEGIMLHKMRHAGLVVVLHKRAGILHKTKTRLARLEGGLAHIVATQDVISEAIVEHSFYKVLGLRHLLQRYRRILLAKVNRLHRTTHIRPVVFGIAHRSAAND